MKNDDYFNKYLRAKLVLNKLVCQFYDYYISKEQADRLGIEYNDESVCNSFDELICVFHRYHPEGLYIWEKYGLEKPILLIEDIWNLRSFNEEKDENRDYYNDYLDLKILDMHLCDEYYSRSISKDDADRLNIMYKELDEFEGYIEGYDHLHESAGEAAWNLFDFECFFVPKSTFSVVKDEMLRQKLQQDYEKYLFEQVEREFNRPEKLDRKTKKYLKRKGLI